VDILYVHNNCAISLYGCKMCSGACIIVHIIYLGVLKVEWAGGMEVSMTLPAHALFNTPVQNNISPLCA
jgi:hypothetical protein